MSTALAMEPRHAPFPTTVGFRSTSGFAVALPPSNDFTCFLPLAEKVGQAHAEVESVGLEAQQPQELSVVVEAEGAAHVTAGKPKSASVSPAPSVNVPPTPDAQENANHVGWRGLLEISQHSGSSGVLGARAGAVAEDLASSVDAQVEICCTAHTTTPIRRLVKSVIRGLKACQEPEKALDGMGGTYFFLNDSGKKAAILKPCDEEPLAPNNPKGYVGRALGDAGWKPTVRVGEAAMREVAAYLLDHDGWARVPTSVLVRARHPVFCYNSLMGSVRAASCLDLAGALRGSAGETSAAVLAMAPGHKLPMKLGSLQEFVSHECDTSEMGTSRFSPRDVHRIGILDIRLFNTDRHAGNMLVRMPRGSAADLKGLRMGGDAPMYELVPIDHGFCLPEMLEAPYFEWLHWPQTMIPFTEDELQYIAKLNIQDDITILQSNLPNLRPECLRVLEVSTTLLQLCAKAGLNLFDIASAMTRPCMDSDEEPSELEKMCLYAHQRVEQVKLAEASELADSAADAGHEEDSNSTIAVLPAGPAAQRACSGFAVIKEESGAEDDMLFMLDENGDASTAASRAGRSGGRVLASAMPASVTVASLQGAGGLAGAVDFGFPSPSTSLNSSSGSTDVLDTLSTSGAGSSMDLAEAGGPGIPIVYGAGGLASAIAASSSGMAAPIPAQMARSMHASDFIFRKQAGTVEAAKRRTQPAAKPRLPQAYPPPVMTFKLDSLNGFSFTAFNKEEWRQFMGELSTAISQAIESGTLKQDPAKDAFNAMSCPRF